MSDSSPSDQPTPGTPPSGQPAPDSGPASSGSPPPPNPPGGGPGGGSGGGALDRVSAWFSEGWTLFQAEAVNLGLAALVYYLVLTVATLACLLPGLVVAGPLAAGMWIVAAYRVLGRRVDIGQVFLGFRRFVPTFLLGLLYFAVPLILGLLIIVPIALSALAAVGFASEAGADAGGVAGVLAGGLGCGVTALLSLVAILYPLVIALFFLFSLPLVLFKGHGVGEALRVSLATCRTHFGTVFLLVLGAGALYVIGASVSSSIPFIGLLLGPLVTAVTIGYLAVVLTVAYRDLFGLVEADLEPYTQGR